MKTNALFPLLGIILAFTCGEGRSQCLNPYTVTGVQMAPGSPNYIQLFANQLDQSPDNSLATVIGGSVPNASKVGKWDDSTGYTFATKKAAAAWNPNLTVNPGEGAFLITPGTAAPTVTFPQSSGTPRTTETPVTITSGAYGPNWYLLSRQKNCPATYEDIVNVAGGGTPPFDGLSLYRLKQSYPFEGAPTVLTAYDPIAWPLAYDIFTYNAGAWAPFAPVMRVGEAVWIGPEVESISGRAYEKNGCPATSGSPLRNWQIKLTGTPTGAGALPISLTTFTDINGKYVFHVPAGTYTVSQVPDPCWLATCPTGPDTYTVTALGIYTNHITDINFAARALNTGTQCDLSVHVFAKYPGIYSAPCCGELMTYKIFYRNTCKQKNNVTLQFTIPGATTINPAGSGSATSPGWVGAGPTYTIPLGLLTVGEIGFKNLQVRVNPIGATCTPVAPQTLLNATATIYPNTALTFTGDSNPANNTDTHSALVTCSYDPNDKEVSPKGCGPTGLINAQPLTYTVHFQNLGSGPAYEVQVHDQLDPSLDASTVEVLSTSHNYGLAMNGSEMVWTFPNILLPAAVDDEDGSNGYLVYRVNPLPGLPEGTVITNQAAIYFDNNPPVLTPTTTNTITLNPLPVASFTVTPRSMSAGHTNDFTYTGGTSGATFLWDFGADANPPTSTDMNPTGVVFANNGLRNVSLRVFTGGCEATPANRRISVGAPRLLFESFEDQACLSWEGAGYSLQEASSLEAPIAWQMSGLPIWQFGVNFSTCLSPTNDMRFYRLIDQP